MAEHEFAVAQGKAASIANAERTWGRMIAAVRAKFLSMGAKLGPQVAIEDDLETCKALIDGAIAEALAELSGYDPGPVEESPAEESVEAIDGRLAYAAAAVKRIRNAVASGGKKDLVVSFVTPPSQPSSTAEYQTSLGGMKALRTAAVRAASLWTPPPWLTVSEWADRYRQLSPEGSSSPGQWVTTRAEFQRGIMDALSDPKVHTVVFPASSQVGKTEMLLNIIAFCICQDPSPILMVQPTLDMAEAFL